MPPRLVAGAAFSLLWGTILSKQAMARMLGRAAGKTRRVGAQAALVAFCAARLGTRPSRSRVRRNRRGHADLNWGEHQSQHADVPGREEGAGARSAHEGESI